MKNTINCRSCPATWEQESKTETAAVYSGECAPCAETRRTAKFVSICPPLYQRTEIKRLPTAQLKKAMAWKYGTRGLMLQGETGMCKTRIAWEVMRRFMVLDQPERAAVFFDAVSFGHELVSHYKAEDAEDWLTRLAKVPLIFFDDLGKLKLTERAEAELFGVVERRCANELPIIVTTNDTPESVKERLTDNRGAALIRRLREFCDPIQF